MIPAIPPLTDKHKKRLKFLFIKLPIILVILIFVMIGALKLVERYPDPLREGFEKYLSQQTNTRATIGHVNKVAFYPNIDIQLEDITLHRSDNAALIDVEAKVFSLNAPLSDIFTRKGRINAFMIENLKMAQNVFTPFEIEVRNANIIDDEDNGKQAYFEAFGVYGGKEFSAQVTLHKNKKSYLIPKIIPFSITIGVYKINAKLQKKAFEVLLTDVVFEKGSKVAPVKDYIFVESDGYKTDNPLSCLYLNAGEDLQQCDQYLESGN